MDNLWKLVDNRVDLVHGSGGPVGSHSERPADPEHSCHSVPHAVHKSHACSSAEPRGFKQVIHTVHNG
ncbi:hypothetical protein FRIGORI9N_470181 [Frigoribacterium sp. 9N]|nr:hypothetical protein FRIGORI9N_470181 [Frigoribacterium sp. 9N]